MLEMFVLEDSVDDLSISICGIIISDPLFIDFDGLLGPEGIKELTLLRNELHVRGVFGVVLPLLIEEACDDDSFFINGNDVDESFKPFDFTVFIRTKAGFTLVAVIKVAAVDVAKVAFVPVAKVLVACKIVPTSFDSR
jgi:hypothetical protein